MFFEGLANPHLGGTVLLRGGSKIELNSLKKISSRMLFTAYNWRLENSFLMDEFASPPPSNCEFLDDSKDNSPEFPGSTFSNHNSIKLEAAVKKSETTIVQKREKLEQITENKKIIVESVKDFTDPLHSYNTDNHNNRNEKLTVTELPFANNFRKCLDDTILCVSPYIVLSVPYLETESGRKSNLRKFFPKDIYLSDQFDSSKKTKRKEFDDKNAVNGKIENKVGDLRLALTEYITLHNLLQNIRFI